jgi:PAS domain S-box-containing protein
MNESFFKFAVEASFEGINITDSDGIILYANPRWLELSGWKNEDVVGKVTPRIIKSGIKDEKFYANLWATIKSGETFRFDTTNKRKDGELYEAEEMIAPIKEGKKLLGFIGFARDVTERNKAEQELRKKTGKLEDLQKALVNTLEDLAKEKENIELKVKKRTRELAAEHGRVLSLLESVKLGVVMLDLNFNVLSSNAAAKEILEIKTEENVKFKDLETKLKSADLSHSLSYYVGEKKVVNIQEAKFNSRYYRLFLSPVRDVERKEFIGAVIVIEDITEAKMVDQMRTEIISTTSHQLRTPLSVVKGNLEMLVNGDLGKVPKGQAEILQEALAGNERMIHLVNDLTDVSKITEGNLGLDFKDENFWSVVEEAVKEIKPLADQNKTKFVFKSTKEVFLVKIDKQRIKQVIQNLISNAVKYGSHDGSGVVEVKTEKTDNLVELIIKDNGAGIPKNEQRKIFEKFFRASNATKLDPGSGTGLGLFIVKSIVELHKGKIWFESEEGKGTTFYLTLPAQIVKNKI